LLGKFKGKPVNRDVIYLLFGGAAGGGKSWFGCEWLLTHCIFFENTKWFIGREELKRLRESTLLTFYKVCKFYKIPRNQVTYNGQDNYFLFNNGSRIDLLDLKFIPSDPLYERYGSLEFTGGWIEEGGEVNFMAFDILKTRIGRQMNDFHDYPKKLLITSNPKKNWLYHLFYKPWRDGTLDSNKAFIQAFVDDNPYNESGYKQSLLDITDKPTKERLLYGNWEYENDPANLMQYDKITDVFTNYFVKGDAKYITADIARFGRDKTVIGYWKGLRLEEIQTIEKNKVTEAAEAITTLRMKHNVPLSNVIVDQDGVGCLVKGTEVLTFKGWMPIEEIGSGDRIYSKDIDNKVIIVNVIKNEFREKTDIIKLKNGYEFSYSHFLPYQSRREYPVKLKSWDWICERNLKLQTDFNWEGKDYDIIIPQVNGNQPNGGTRKYFDEIKIKSIDFARFLGWFLSEGYLDQKHIGIAQSIKSKHNERIQQIIKSCGLSYYRKKYKDEYFHITANKNLLNWLKENCYTEKNHIAINKKVPDVLKMMSRDSILAFLKEYVNGDGYYHRGGMEFSTSSKKMAGDLHELLLKAGKYGNSYIKHKAGSIGFIEGRQITRTRDHYLIYEWKNNDIRVNSKIEKIYEDNVYNLKIEGETRLYMIRMKDGKSFWVHNGGVQDILDCKGFVNNSKPKYDNGKQNFDNLKSQCYFKLAQKINDSEIFISAEGEQRERIIEELEVVKQDKVDTDGKKSVIKKDKVKELIGRSPDLSDMIMMRMYFELQSGGDFEFLNK